MSESLLELITCVLFIFGIAFLFAAIKFLFMIGYELIKQAISERNSIRETIEESKNKSMIEENKK